MCVAKPPKVSVLLARLLGLQSFYGLANPPALLTAAVLSFGDDFDCFCNTHEASASVMLTARDLAWLSTQMKDKGEYCGP